MKFIIALSLFCSLAYSQNKILILSGGVSPKHNHYSQYLQTKSLYQYVLKEVGTENVDLMFGAGNNKKTISLVKDVHKVVKPFFSRKKKSTFVPGVIVNNQEASPENVNNYFDQSSNFNNLTPSDTFFLFVSDHGSPYEGQNGRTYNNNCIDLWRIDPEHPDKRRSYEDSCFNRTDLQAKLERSKAKKNVFVMSQCYSGSFHYMNFKLINKRVKVYNKNICGCTSTMPIYYASGCTPDVSGDNWKGYERHFTEAFIGKNILKNKRTSNPIPKLMDAHREASLVDMTVDIPISTLDLYLNTWANQIAFKNFEHTSLSKETLESIYYRNYEKETLVHNSKENADFYHFIQKMEMSLFDHNKNFSFLLEKLSVEKMEEYIFESYTKYIKAGKKYYETRDKSLIDLLNHYEKEMRMIERIHVYKKALAAWATLDEINDDTALEDIDSLNDCLNTRF